MVGCKRGGRASRDKGNRAERAIVRYLQDRGFASERVPLSGSARGRFDGDISIPLLGVDRRVEVKCRGNGFARLYDWLAGNDFLIVKCDRAEPLVVIPLRLASEIALAAEGRKAPVVTPIPSGGDQTGFIPAASCLHPNSCHRHGQCMYVGCRSHPSFLDAATRGPSFLDEVPGGPCGVEKTISDASFLEEKRDAGSETRS
jgi:hypothetical protein